MKAFIFDLDGVIVFTDKFHYQAWKKMADEMGIYFDETINNRLRGVSRSESLEIILERYEGPALSKEKKAELMDKLGLGESAQPPLTGNARTEALATLDQMLSDFRKQLMDKLNAENKLDQQNSTLSTFLQKMS